MLGLAIRLAAGAARRLVPKAAAWAGSRLGRAATSRAGRVAITLGSGVAVDRAVNRLAGGSGVPSFPTGVSTFQAPQPREGRIGRTVSRILPGGMTGREFMPATDMTDKIGRPLAVYPEEITQVRGPRGYVVVTYNGEKVAMLRAVAIRTGLYNPPPKPPLSGYDMRAINRANSARKRVKKLAGKVGFKCASRAGKC